MALDIDFKCIHVSDARRIQVLNNSGAKMYEGDGFKIASGTVGVLDDDNTVGLAGIWCADVADDAVGYAYITGTFLVDVEGTIDFALGGAVYSAGASSVDTGTAGDIPIGHIVKENPASGASTVTIEICTQFSDRSALS